VGSPDPASDTIEETTRFAPRFGPDGLIAAIVADAASNEVLMFAWMNQEALALTLETGEAHFWSRSRGVVAQGRDLGRSLRGGRNPDRLRPGRAACCGPRRAGKALPATPAGARASTGRSTPPRPARWCSATPAA
jgi:hypothetical protein